MARLANCRALTLVLAAIAGSSVPRCAAQTGNSKVEDEIQQVTQRPEFRHSIFGAEVYSFDENKVVYELNWQQLFTPASTTKLLTEGTALELLGTDYRFHT